MVRFKFLLSTSYSHMLVFHFSCSSSLNVCINCSPSLPSHLSVNWDLFIILCFIANSPENILYLYLTFHRFWYLYVTFQSNVSSFSAGPSAVGITCTDLAASYLFDCHYCCFGCFCGCLCDCLHHVLFWLPFVFCIFCV